MKIVAINGSPRGKKSATFLMIEEFFKGAQEAGAKTKQYLLSDMKIHHCIGCMSCWTKTLGECVFHDDMEKINVYNCDLLIFATPLYVYNVSGLLKNFIDRSIVWTKKKNMKPFKYMVISNCGYSGLENFDGLRAVFRGMANYVETDIVAEIYRDQGGVLLNFSEKEIPAINEYKKLLRFAGREVVQNGKISFQTQKKLEKSFFSHDVFQKMHEQWFNQFEQK